MRRPAALLSLLAALLLVGCGGQQITADEVSGAPPELPVPDAQNAGALQESARPESGSRSSDADGADSSSDGDAAAGDGSESGGSGASSGDSGASSGDSGASSGGSTGGAAAPQATATPAPQAPAAPQDDAQNDTSPPADSGAERFEDFCQQNPGAC